MISGHRTSEPCLPRSMSRQAIRNTSNRAMNRISMAPFAAAIHKTCSIEIVDEFTELFRHAVRTSRWVAYEELWRSSRERS